MGRASARPVSNLRTGMTTALWMPQRARQAEEREKFDVYSPVWVSDEILPEGDRAALYSLPIICPYCKRTHDVQVLGTTADSRWELEDEYLEAIERWLSECHEKEHKRQPTEDEKAQIGQALEDFRQHTLRRRASSNGRLYY